VNINANPETLKPGTDVVLFNSSGDTTGSLIVFEDARRAIADAETVEQVNKILALATGLAAAARKATNHEVEAEAAVLKLEAERKLGQLMEAQKESVGFNKGGRPKTGIPENPVSDKPLTLAEAGIDKNLAAKARAAAAMPETEFEQAKGAKREAVLNGGERSKPCKRKSRFDAEHYAFMLGQHIEGLATLSEEYPERFEGVLGHLLGDANFIDSLDELAGHPKFSAFLAAVAAKLGDDSGPYSAGEHDHLRARVDELNAEKRRLEIKIVGLESEVKDLEQQLRNGAAEPPLGESIAAPVNSIEPPVTVTAPVSGTTVEPRVEPPSTDAASVAGSDYPIPDDLSIPSWLQREAP
jgi:hypothetical protein